MTHCCVEFLQGHLTNAALWGPEKHQHSTNGSSGGSTNMSSSFSSSIDGISSSSPADPAQQPVWSLQHLFDVVGQQHAQHVWQQILDTAGEVALTALEALGGEVIVRVVQDALLSCQLVLFERLC